MPATTSLRSIPADPVSYAPRGRCATPMVTLVVEPGRYKFLDFVKVGVPLLLLTYLTTALVAPLIFPFHPS